MHLVAKILLAILVNAAILFAAARFIPGIAVSGNAKEVLTIALTLTALNFFLKPIIKMILGPVIVFTFGAGLLLVNALILFILDFFFYSLTIQGTLALFYITLLISATNFVYHLSTKS